MRAQVLAVDWFGKACVQCLLVSQSAELAAAG
jgi:hypothetical protein